jgi:hypothetical protein
MDIKGDGQQKHPAQKVQAVCCTLRVPACSPLPIAAALAATFDRRAVPADAHLI